MNQDPAGGGPDIRAEFIADSVVHESVRVDLAVCEYGLSEMREAFLQVIHRVHNTYHVKGVAKPPSWEQCHRSTCRQAQLVLLGEGEREQ